MAHNQNLYEQEVENKQAQLDQQTEAKKKDRIWSMIGTGIGALSSAFSDEGCKSFAKRAVFK